MKILYLNGPPECGKDHFANYVHANLDMFSTVMEFKHPSMIALEPLIGSLANYEQLKRSKEPIIEGGPDVREFMIRYSEDFMKKLFGRNIFGKLMASRIYSEVEDPNGLVLIPDCGFAEEVAECVSSIEAEHIVYRLHREGKTFEGDSRAYIGDRPNRGCSAVEYMTYVKPAYKQIEHGARIIDVNVPEGTEAFNALIEKLVK